MFKHFHWYLIRGLSGRSIPLMVEAGRAVVIIFDVKFHQQSPTLVFNLLFVIKFVLVSKDLYLQSSRCLVSPTKPRQCFNPYCLNLRRKYWTLYLNPRISEVFVRLNFWQITSGEQSCITLNVTTRDVLIRVYLATKSQIIDQQPALSEKSPSTVLNCPRIWTFICQPFAHKLIEKHEIQDLANRNHFEIRFQENFNF